MEDTKPKWIAKSLTIWGVIITTAAAVVPVIGQYFGIDISAPDIIGLGDAVTGAIQAILAALGPVLTIWGRIRAKQPVTVSKPV